MLKCSLCSNTICRIQAIAMRPLYCKEIKTIMSPMELKMQPTFFFNVLWVAGEEGYYFQRKLVLLGFYP
jgi:hypothetical protein